MPDIRLTALSDSLANTYGVLHYTGDGVFLQGTGGDLNLVCGQCEHVIAENLEGLPNFHNAAANCPGCGTAVHLTRPSRYSQPVTMKRNLDERTPPQEVFQTSNLHKGLECEELITETTNKLLDEFAERQGPPPRILYHYTSGIGLAGIVSTGCLWATDIAYMNDTSELQYATDLINEDVERKAATSNPLVAELLRRANHPTAPTGASSAYYAACFCTDGDLLSQWRAYGDFGKGFALGFDAYEFTGVQHRARKVIYDSKIQRQLIRSTIESFASVFEEVSEGKTQESLDQERILPAFSAAIASILAEYTFSFKHPAFSGEGEWRFITEFRRDVHLPFVKFRNSKDLIIPYLAVFLGGQRDDERPLAKPPLALLEVVQGPTLHPDLNVKATHLLLEQNGYEHVEVTASQTPLRI